MEASNAANKNRKRISIATNTNCARKTDVESSTDKTIGTADSVGGKTFASSKTAASFRRRLFSLKNENAEPSESETSAPNSQKNSRRSIPTRPDTSDRSESLSELVNRLVVSAVFAVARLKDAITSEEYRNGATRVFRTFGLIFNTRVLRGVLKSTADVFENVFKVSTDVNIYEGVNKISVEIMPILED